MFPVIEPTFTSHIAGFCTGQILKLVQHIEDGFQSSLITAVFIDLSAAYDTGNFWNYIPHMTLLWLTALTQSFSLGSWHTIRKFKPQNFIQNVQSLIVQYLDWEIRFKFSCNLSLNLLGWDFFLFSTKCKCFSPQSHIFREVDYKHFLWPEWIENSSEQELSSIQYAVGLFFKKKSNFIIFLQKLVSFFLQIQLFIVQD